MITNNFNIDEEIKALLEEFLEIREYNLFVSEIKKLFVKFYNKEKNIENS